MSPQLKPIFLTLVTACDPNLIKPVFKSIMASRPSSPADDQPDIQPGDMPLEPISSPDANAPFTELLLHNASPLNLSLTPPGSETARFHVVNSVFNPRAPHVTLHAGPDKLAPVVGVAHLHYCSTNAIGLGDPNNSAHSVIWETLARTSRWTHSTYTYDFLFAEQGRTSFIWERDRMPGFDDQAPMHLYEEGRPDVVLARFESNSPFRWRKRGRFFIRDGFGDGWALMALLTGLALIELSRRRARQRRHL